MKATSILDVRVSYGHRIKAPDELAEGRVGELLAAIRDGEWKRQVVRVRCLGDDPEAQTKSKFKLPFVVSSGLFSNRSVNGLENHSGLIGIDLDDLGRKPGFVPKVSLLSAIH